MKKISVIAAMALTLGGATLATASAQEWRDDRRSDRGERDSRWRGGGEQLNRLNWQFERVRERMREVGASRYVRARFSELLAERDRLNWQVRRRTIEPYRLARRVDYMRAELRHLELRMHNERGHRAIGIRVY